MSTPTAYFGKAKSTFSKAELRRQHLGQAAEAGLKFDGAAGYIDIASPPDLGTKFSMEFIIQASSYSAGNNSYLVDFDGGGSARFVFGNTAANSGNLAIYDRTDWRVFSPAVKVIDDLAVHHLVVTVDGSTATLYDNGNQIATATGIGAHNIDYATDANIGRSVSVHSWLDGTLYRTRFWNKTLSQTDVTSVYESASIDFADQWGSQTSLVSAWTNNGGPDGYETFTSSGAAISSAINSSGFGICASAITLTAGSKYRINHTFTKNSGTSPTIRVGDAGNLSTTIFNELATSASEFDFTATTSGTWYIGYRVESGIATNFAVAGFSIVKTGAVADFDLAYANPTQSTIVQNRSGSGDGTAEGGVTQITKIEAVNTNKLNVGGTTPLVGIGLAAGTTPLGLLHLEKSGGADLIMHQTVADTTGYLGAIQFGNKNDDPYLATIAGIQDGHAGSGKLEFQTQADGGTKATRLTISSAGDVLVGHSHTPQALMDVRKNAAGDILYIGGSDEATIGQRGLKFTCADEGINKGAVWTADATSAAGQIKLATGGTPRLSISSAGLVSIGAESFTAHTAADDLVIKPAAADNGLTIRSTGTGSIFFGDAASNAVGQIRYNHGTDNMSIEAADEINFTCDLATFSSGIAVTTGGIQFPATQSASADANNLDDYEEGVWVPMITDGTNEATMSGTYNKGLYTKVGRMVTVTGYVVTTSLGSVSGAIKISGLPFLVKNEFGAITGGTFGSAGGFALTAGDSLVAAPALNTNLVNLHKTGATTGTSALQGSEWTAGGNVGFSLTYFA